MFQTLQYGFPNKPTALAWDPLLRTMAIGTSTGSIKVYPLTCYFILRLASKICFAHRIKCSSHIFSKYFKHKFNNLFIFLLIKLPHGKRDNTL